MSDLLDGDPNIRGEQQQPLTDWEKEPTVRDLKQDFENARPAHTEQMSNISRWLDNLHITGSAKPEFDKSNPKSVVAPKLIRKQAEWRYAALSEPFLSTDDVFNVEPVTFEDDKAAKQNQLVLNYQFNNKINKVRFINEYVRSAVDEGTVICRTEWQFEEDLVEVEKDIFTFTESRDIQLAQYYMQIAQALSDNPGLLDTLPKEVKAGYLYSAQQQTPYTAKYVRTDTVEEVVTVANHPYVEVVNSNNIVFDPSCKGDLDKAKFAIYSFETSKSELEADGRYKNLDLIDVQSNNILGEPDHTSEDASSFNFEDEARKKFVAYEYWGYRDITGDGSLTSIVATYVGDVMIRMEENPFPDGKLPFVVASYLPVRKSLYGEPDGELLEDNQKIVGAVTRGMIDIMAKSANGQRGFRKDALDITNRRKFEKGLDYEFNQNIPDPRQAFYVHQFGEIPASAQYMIDLQNTEAESLTGVKAFSSGISGQALGNTATGIRSALDATSKRELDILNRLAEGIKDIGRKFISMNAEFLEEEEVIRITNGTFVPVRRDDLAGRFDLKLSISTAEADNQKASELAFMLQTVGNNIDPGLSKMVLSEIAELRKMPHLAKRIESYEPQPNPLEQEKQMLEVELLKAQIANEQSKAQENMTDAGLNDAKRRTELAKTRNLDSDSDLKDLDYVEQESSTKHARDIDKIKSQAEAQTDMKIIESALDPSTNVDDKTVSNGLESV